jgi:hypothetical protein
LVFTNRSWKWRNSSSKHIGYDIIFFWEIERISVYFHNQFMCLGLFLRYHEHKYGKTNLNFQFSWWKLLCIARMVSTSQIR